MNISFVIEIGDSADTNFRANCVENRTIGELRALLSDKETRILESLEFDGIVYLADAETEGDLWEGIKEVSKDDPVCSFDEIVEVLKSTLESADEVAEGMFDDEDQE
jgi:hypothetical protein